MKKNKKLLALVCCMALLVVSAGATLAWLAATSGPITNTFTTSDIAIELEETTGGENNEYKMVPGSVIDKDPTVTVFGGSEKCWLFVKVEKDNNFDEYIDYVMEEGWTPYSGEEGVFYRIVGASDGDQEFDVIGYKKDGKFIADQVLVKTNVSSAMMKTASKAKPTIKFTAYAVQWENIPDVAAAWAAAQDSANY